MSNLVQEKEPNEDNNSLQTKNFKVILALKLDNNNYGLNNLQCQVKILDKIKVTELPQSEGQFYDLRDLPVGTIIEMEIMTQHQKLGQISVNVPDKILNSEETELSDNVIINTTYKNKKISLKFKYYIIILNKKIFLEKNSKKIFRHQEQDSQFFDQKEAAKSQSPSTMKFIKSSQEHEDSKYNQVVGKRLLDGNKPIKTHDLSLTPPRNEKTAEKEHHELRPTIRTPTNQKNVHDSDKISPMKNNNRSTSPFTKYNDKPLSKEVVVNKSQNKLQVEIDFLKRQLQANQTNQNDSINQSIMKESLNESEQRRSVLQDILKSSVEDNMKLKEEVQINIQDAIEKRVHAEKQTADIQQKFFQLQNKQEELELELTKKNNSIQELEQKNLLIEEFVKLCKEQQAKLEAQDKKLKIMQEQGSIPAPKEPQGKNIMSQLKTLNEQLQKIKTDLVKEQSKNNHLQTQLENQQNKQQLESAKMGALQKTQDQNDRLNRQVKELRQKNDENVTLIEDLKKQILKLEDKGVSPEEEELRKVISQLKRTINDQSNQLDDKNLENLKIKYNIQELKMKLDEKQNKEDMLSHNANLVKENMQLLDTVNELTQQLRNTNKQARLTAKDYEHEVEDKEENLNTMKRMILQMKERGQIYLPDSKDKIDKTLAISLNAKEDYEQIRNMFLRESEGVYQFGSKKIYIKVEQDRVKIRSGGGYISLEEFLQLFSQTEMEKISRQDPMTSMSKNKAVQRKIDDMRLVNKIKDGDSQKKK